MCVTFNKFPIVNYAIFIFTIIQLIAHVINPLIGKPASSRQLNVRPKSCGLMT